MTFLRVGACGVVAASMALGCSWNGANAPEGTDASGGGNDAAQDVDATPQGDSSPSGDDGSVDAGDGGGGDAGSDCANYKYCETFESYGGAITNNQALGPWKASVAGTGIQMQVDTVKPYRGTKSLHISVPTGASAHGTLTQSAAAGLVPGNDVYGRAMVFYASGGGNDLPLGVHSWIFNSAGTSSMADGGVTMNMGGGGAKMQLNYHPPPPGTEKSVQGGMIAAGSWHCIQWQYDGSGKTPADAAKVWVDGTVAVNVPASQGWDFATPWDTFDFGFTHYQTLANGVDVYLDEFALDGSMVACP
jgi:hypothetical protein